MSDACPVPVRRAARIPLTITATGTGKVTTDVLVAVLASDLDAYEEVLWQLSNFTAMVAATAVDGWREAEKATLGPDADALWQRISDLAGHYEEGIVPDA